MKTKVCLMLTVVVLLVTCIGSVGVYALDTAPMNQAELIAETWVNNNYGGYYDIRNLHSTLIKTVKTEDSVQYTIAITCDTRLKVKDAEELPFIKGMRAEAATRTSLSKASSTAIEAYVDEIEGYIGNYYPLSVDVVVEIGNSKKNEPATLYYQDVQATVLLPIEELKIDEAQMMSAGADMVDQLISFSNSATRGYDAYDRIAARDYALTYSSNPTDCSDCGTTCGIRQDRTKWNNTDYPYIDNLKHADCADYVSQAMYAGGIPIEAGVWQRFYDGNNGWSWTSGAGLKNYMVNKGYWDLTTFDLCNAGNIIRWLSSSDSANHVGMITLNDTVTHRYTAHTSDRLNYLFTNSNYYQTNCEFYMIKFD